MPEKSDLYSRHYLCTGLTSIVLPDSVTDVGFSAFDSCINLKSITIPGSVKSIGERAFNDCPNLILTVREGSYAMEYAAENGLLYSLFAGD